MKKQTSIILAALVATTLHAAAQGSLTPPPGAPAPVMKSLDQVEARIPLVAGQPGVSVNGVTGTITINASGSYYLTNNLTISTGAHGIHIVGAVTVDVDLNGYTITGTIGSGFTFGVYPDGHADGQFVAIRNGFIRGATTAGFAYAIGDDGNSPFPNATVENVHCVKVRNGIDFTLGVPQITTVDHCSVTNSGGGGIRADAVRNCSVQTCGTVGISAWSMVSHSRVMGATGNGIVAGGAGCIVSNCYASSSSSGIICPTVVDSYGNGAGASNYGIDATTANGCRGRNGLGGGTGVAIRATIAVACSAEFGTVSITNKYNMP